MSEHLDQRLARAESTLVSLQGATADAICIARQFGDDIGEIGRELTQHPELEARESSHRPIVARDTGLLFWLIACVTVRGRDERAGGSGRVSIRDSIATIATDTPFK